MSSKKFTCDWLIEADSSLAVILDYFNKSSHSKRSQIERGLVSFFLPEAYLQSGQSLTPQQEWELYNAIYDLEKQLKLYRQFLLEVKPTLNALDLDDRGGEPQNLFQVKQEADAVGLATANFSGEGDDFDDDDFSDGGI
jgi:hypothetical protein